MQLKWIWKILLLALFLLPAGSCWAAQVKTVNADQARKMVAETTDLYLLDVRTPQEYAEVRMEDAQLVPINELVARLDEIPKTRPILVYCAVGSRSSQVANYLARAGYADVSNLSGGIWGWQLRGYPVLKGLP